MFFFSHKISHPQQFWMLETIIQSNPFAILTAIFIEECEKMLKMTHL